MKPEELLGSIGNDVERVRYGCHFVCITSLPSNEFV